MQENPFRISGSITGDFFTNRDTEVTRMVRTLMEPQAKLLVYGPRRMGKTSALEVAIERVRSAGYLAIMVDFSTASSLSDISTRLLQAATKALGAHRKSQLSKLVSNLKIGLSLSTDPLTNLPSVSLDLSHRDAPIESQRQTLADVLNAIDALAGEKQKTIGIVIDEFQEIRRFGAEMAEWHLRGTIQLHKNVSYILAGSRESIILSMLGKKRAFYGMLEQLYIGPINERHMAEWIEARFQSSGYTPNGIGHEIVAVAGSRSRDIVQLARATYDVATPGVALTSHDVATALWNLVADMGEYFRVEWERLTAIQQNVLRAIAATEPSLFSETIRRRYGLRSSAAIASAVEAMLNKEIIVKTHAGNYAVDNPFMRRWIEVTTLSDVQHIPQGYFGIHETNDNKYYFQLRFGSGETVLTSELFSDQERAQKAANATKKLLHNDQNIFRKTSAHSSYFVVMTEKKHVLARSEHYPSVRGMEKHISLLQQMAVKDTLRVP